ncbi:MAG: hypothetical protein RI563_02145, partial [Thiohalophilus sp.]|uniref:hypothetical protein n=1 Tax=Thiohalophilus sp. TaxID=3028392 RepID=UPI0028705296
MTTSGKNATPRGVATGLDDLIWLTRPIIPNPVGRILIQIKPAAVGPNNTQAQKKGPEGPFFSGSTPVLFGVAFLGFLDDFFRHVGRARHVVG